MTENKPLLVLNEIPKGFEMNNHDNISVWGCEYNEEPVFDPSRCDGYYKGLCRYMPKKDSFFRCNAVELKIYNPTMHELKEKK